MYCYHTHFFSSSPHYTMYYCCHIHFYPHYLDLSYHTMVLLPHMYLFHITLLHHVLLPSPIPNFFHNWYPARLAQIRREFLFTLFRCNKRIKDFLFWAWYRFSHIETVCHIDNFTWWFKQQKECELPISTTMNNSISYFQTAD